MKRDMDLVRAILFSFEDTDEDRVSPKNMKVKGYSDDQIAFHIELMKEADLLHHEIIRPQSPSGHAFMVRFDAGMRPTMKGYDFLDSVRDPEVWKRTKEGAAKVGGMGIDLLWEVGKAYTKQLIKDRLGIDLP